MHHLTSLEPTRKKKREREKKTQEVLQMIGVILGLTIGLLLGVLFWTWTLLLTLLLVVGGGALVLVRKRRRAARAAAGGKALGPQTGKLAPRSGLPLSGLRVLELANTMAAPNATKILAELGAEVIKVEPPNGGDNFRAFLNVIQPGREQSVVFDWVNAGKNSVALDYTTAEGLSSLKTLLRNADILVTNVRLQSLTRYGLDYESLRDEFPHLVYAGLTAWGSVGPDINLPGYDIGCFWAATGLSVLSQLQQGTYSYYAAGSGDVFSSTALVFGIMTALRERAISGIGQLVSTSLLKVGTWAMSPIHTTLPVPKAEELGASRTPDYSHNWNTVHPLDASYRTRDGVLVQLHALAALTNPPPSHWPSGVNYQDRAAVAKCVGALDEASLPFPHVTILTLEDVWTKVTPNEHFKTARCLVAPPDPVKPDQPRFASPVCLFSGIPEHEQRSKIAAPRLGEHTESILREGWAPRPVDFWGSPSASSLQSPYRDLLVLEVTDHATLVPALVGRSLHEFGASVIRVLVERDPLTSTNGVLHDQLNKGKRSVAVQSWSEVRTLLEKRGGGDVLLVTDLPRSVLLKAGIDYESIHASFPRVSYAWLTPFGPEGAEEPRNSRATFLAMSGIMVTTMGRDSDRASPFSPYFGDFITAMHLCSGISVALYAAARGGPSGQRIDANFLRSGVYSCGVGAPLYLFSPRIAETSQQPTTAQMHTWYPQPTTNCYRTKDGVWILMLGVDLPRHLPKMLKAAGFGPRYWLSRFPHILTKVIPASPGRLAKFKAFCQMMMPDFLEVFGTKTLAEWKPIFDALDVWYCIVNTPQEARRSKQCQEIGIFQVVDEGQHTHVNFPVRLYGQRVHDCHGAPAHGEGNSEFFG